MPETSDEKYTGVWNPLSVAFAILGGAVLILGVLDELDVIPDVNGDGR